MLLDTPILNKTYDLYKLLCRFRSRIPKSDRYTLWVECETTVLSILKAIINTTHQRGDKRTESLYSISNHVDLLKVLIRLAKDNLAIDLNQYDAIQGQVEEASLSCRSTINETKTGSTASETFRRLYISSRPASAKDFAKWIRQHWHIENRCHWVADVIFREDDILMDRGNSAENLGLFRKLAINMAAIVDPERGFASVRRAATFGVGYLQGVLARFFCPNVSKNFS